VKVVKAIRHAGIVVTDMDRAVAFYRDLLGLKEVANFVDEGEYIDTIIGLKNVKLWMIKLIAEDGSMIELLHYLSHPRRSLSNRNLNDAGCSHVAFTVEDLDKSYHRLLEAGVRFIDAPCVSPDGHAKVAFCQDPEGVFVELVEVLTRCAA